MHIRTGLLALTMIGGAAVNAGAQAVTSLPRNEMTISIGWLGAKYPGLERYNRWHQSVFSGAGGGHYWNDHFKTEVEAAWMSHVAADSYEPEIVSGGTAYVRSGYGFQTVRLSVGQLYQFGENAWVHPYLGAGADVDYLRTTETRPEQTASVFPTGSSTSRSVVVPGAFEREAGVRTRPFVKGGFKMYASDRVFFTTEWKFGIGDGVQHVLWKTGFGVDF
jgi:hypothetical protein